MDYRIRMRNLREDSDLTQKQVGAIINKSQQGYSHLEDGRAEWVPLGFQGRAPAVITAGEKEL